MAGGKGEDWFKLPAIGVVALVAAVAGHIWKSPAPYVDERPGSGAASSQEQRAAQDVEARLWQDPFSNGGAKPIVLSVGLHGEKPVELRLGETSNDTSHDEESVYFGWKDAPTCRLTIIAALLPGGKYAEEVEARQRQRYALLSALAVRDFTPVDAEHLGYFHPRQSTQRDAPPDRSKRIWFEWFEARKAPEGKALPAECGDAASAERALVLWVNDARFDDRPIAKIRKILAEASPRQRDHQPLHGKPRYVVIGPNQSAQLAALADEALSPEPRASDMEKVAVKRADVQFFPALATAANPVLLGRKRKECGNLELADCLWEHVPLDLTDFPLGAVAKNCGPAALGNCGNFHPPAPERWGWKRFALLAAALALAIVLASRMSWTVREALSGGFAQAAAVATPLLVALAAACPYFGGRDGEPFYWANGVSIWPSELLRLLAVALVAALLYEAWRAIEGDKSEYLADFELKGEIDRLRPELLAKWSRPSNVKRWRDSPLADGTQVDVASLLVQYHELGRAKLRLYRCAVNTFWFILFSFVLMAVWGTPHTPARGDAAFWIDKAIVFVAGVSAVFLTVWIVDAARLCQRMIRHLAVHPSRWPDATVAHFADKLNMRKEDGIADWIDVEFIGRHTAVIQKLIWYPVLPLLLMIFARNAVFDDWDFPPALVVVVGLNLAYAFSCLFLLQDCAKQARNKAVRKLTERLDQLRGDLNPDGQRIGQAEELRRRVAELRTGAFEPLVEQPMFKALLALLGGGGLAMTDLVGLLA